MYHSYLVINTGGNPDRPRPGRNWLNNIYAVHQRLSMGFPTDNQLYDFPDFLNPFDMSGFTNDGNKPYESGENIKNLKRGETNRPSFQFRIENIVRDNHTKAIICIQSERKPNWEYAFRNAGYLLDDVPIGEPREYEPEFWEGQELKFRININLSKKNSKYDKYGNLRSEQDRRKRVSYIWNNKNYLDYDDKVSKEDDIKKWFENKAKNCNLGFDVTACGIVYLGWNYGWKHFKNESKARTLRFRSALLEGKLKVTNPEQFNKAIREGIGSAKAFGFGLLSVAPVQL